VIIRTTNYIKKHLFVITTVLFSSILRWVLIVRGGQFFLPDENRYGIAQDTMVFLLEGKIKTALLTLLEELAHVGFKVAALIPALFENRFKTTLALPAIFLSLFSILNLLLIWKIAKASNAPPRVANYALIIAASSQVLMYYSRHLFPYDQAMFFGLLALYLTLQYSPTRRILYLSGFLSFLCFVTYNGYWSIAAYAIIVNLFHGEKEKNWMFRRSIYLGLGILTPISILFMVCILIGKDIFGDYGVYLQKITQGNFGNGWSLPFHYFWDTEHGLLLVIGFFTIHALFQLARQRNKLLLIGFGGIIFVYLCLVIPSNITHTFVVYARTARQLLPFLILTSAYGLYNLYVWKPRGRWLANFVIAVMLLQAAWNYQLAYKIIFPREFIKEFQIQYPDFHISEKMMRFYAPLICQDQGILAINLHYIYNAPQSISPFQGAVLMRATHPVSYLPYQYDGYTFEQRNSFRNENIEMVFIKLDSSSQVGSKSQPENCNQEK
jgi:hypothetical protein